MGIWANQVLGLFAGFVLLLIAFRTCSAIRRSGLRGVRPAWWQKLLVAARSLADVALQGFLALFVLAVGFFFFALGSEWYDMPEMSNLCRLIGILLMLLAAPGMVVYFYVQLQPIRIAPPGPTPGWLAWSVGLICLAAIDAAILAGCDFAAGHNPLYGMLAGAIAVPIMFWGNWAALLELRSGMEVGLFRALGLIARGIAVLLESSFIGSAIAAGGLLFVALSANAGWGLWPAVLFKLFGLTLAMVGGPLACVVWWWQKRPQLVQLRMFSESEVARSLLRQQAREDANWQALGHGELVHVVDIPTPERSVPLGPTSRRWLRTETSFLGQEASSMPAVIPLPGPIAEPPRLLPAASSEEISTANTVNHSVPLDR